MSHLKWCLLSLLPAIAALGVVFSMQCSAKPVPAHNVVTALVRRGSSMIVKSANLTKGRSVASFAIVSAVFSRHSDPSFKIPCLMSFSSIARQAYPHWVLVLVGDGLTPEDVGRVFNAAGAAGIPSEKLIFQNMDEALRERHIYKDRHALWSHAGTNALNLGLRAAYNLSTITHIARIDDDDYWFEEHLQNIADAYALFPNASFAYSQAVGVGSGPFPRAYTETRFTNRPPAPCELIHATASWSSSLRVFYRQAGEQRLSKRGPLPCCGRPCPQGTILPADADMWERIRSSFANGSIASVFVNKADVHYTNKPEKACLHSTIANVSIPACAIQALDHVDSLANSTCLSL